MNWNTGKKQHRKSYEQRVIEKIRFAGPDECWEWQGCVNKYGYGVTWNGERTVLAHRAYYEMVNGPISNDLYLCHKCDNPRCVNPNHLFEGTPKDNMVDMTVKGRHWDFHGYQGEEHPRHKLTADQVKEIRNYYDLRQRSIRGMAKIYGVSARTITDIVKGKSWKNIT